MPLLHSNSGSTSVTSDKSTRICFMSLHLLSMLNLFVSTFDLLMVVLSYAYVHHSHELQHGEMRLRAIWID